MPFGFHLATDTLPSRESILWPTTHYRHLWIWRPSFERQRDFNPPDQRAAQRTSGRRRRAVALASVRRSNCTCRFPAYSFHEDARVREREPSEGITEIRFTKPNSSYSFTLGN